MPGPSIMALGPFVFEAMGFGFDARRRNQGTRWAEIPVAGGLNPIQWTGGDGSTMEIRGVIFTLEWGGDDTLRGLYRAQEAGQILPLVTMSGTQNIHDMWVIEDVFDDHAYINAGGVAQMQTYGIQLRAYLQSATGFSPASVLSWF